MKQKDIVTITIIVGVSILFSIFLSKVFISSPKNRSQKVELVDKVSAEFTRPDEKIFNKTAINPTQNIQIGTEKNAKPFSGGQ